MKKEKTVESKCCFTCGFRTFHPPETRGGKLFFRYFVCRNAGVTGKTLVTAKDVCTHWVMTIVDIKS